jgi:two-component system, LytTR family, sensor histidine kinase AlgZ
VWVRARTEGAAVVVTIGNTVTDRIGNGTRTAGDEARARLRHAFGEQAAVKLHRDGEHFEIDISLPRQGETKGGLR